MPALRLAPPGNPADRPTHVRLPPLPGVAGARRIAAARSRVIAFSQVIRARAGKEGFIVKTTYGVSLAAAVLLLVTASASAQNNFVANGNFDTDVNGWSLNTGVTVAFDAAFGNTSPGS